MRSKLLWLFSCLLLAGIPSLLAQEQDNKTEKVQVIGQPTSMRYVAPLSTRSNLIIADLSEEKEMQDGRSWQYNIIPGKDKGGDDILAKNPHPLKNTLQTRGLNNNFQSGASNSNPTDPAGAVGLNHYVAVINTAFQIYDKNGTALTGSLSPDNIFTAGACCDLTMSYDNRADRWVMSILYVGAGIEIAVSDGPNPVTAGWYVYSYAQVTDYQKVSVWSDGYYMTDNTGSPNTMHVFEREKMLVGDPGAQILSFALPGIVTSGFYGLQAFNVSDNNLPDLGACPVVYMADNAWGVTQDHIKLWLIDVDWDTPANSTVTGPSNLGIDAGTGTVTPFISVFDNGNFDNLTQPGGGNDIDALQATIMNQAHYRWFPTHRSAVFSFVVDTDGTVGELAGVRWYELRQNGDGMPWYVYQEGTYTSPDGKHAWNGSLAMDSEGNIGMGYSAMGGPTTPGTVHVGSYYTGRFAADPLGTMTVAETVIRAGDASIPSFRYADYSKIDIDPVNDKEFWYNNELMSGGKKNWVGVFQIATDKTNDVGVIAITAPQATSGSNPAQDITVTLYNYGSASASNFDVTYQVDGGALVTETYAGPLAPNASDSFTFSTTADLSAIQTYFIQSATAMGSDQDNGNNFTNCYVTTINANDIGVTDILAPQSGEGLGTESIQIEITNFGSSAQTNFDVSYTLDAGTPVVETVAGPLSALGTLNYTFTAQGDFSSLGDHDLSATTQLAGDSDNSNDTFMTTVTNLSCESMTNSTAMPIGPNAGQVTTSVVTFVNDFVIDDVNVTVNLNHTWDGDLEIKLVAPGGTQEVVLSNQIGGSGDNYTNTVFDDQAAASITSGSPPFTGTFQPDPGSLATLNTLQSVGDWSLLITDNANFDGGQLNSWTLQLCQNPNLSIDEQLVDEDIIIIYEEDNHFLIKLPTTAITDRLDLNVYDVLGRSIYWRNLDNETGNGYEHRLNMSYMAAGVYFVKIGNGTRSNIKRIIVK